MILIIDNYDSFSYNLYQLFGAVTHNIKVVRNDKIDIDGIKALNPSHIVLSPGPGYPKDAGICLGTVHEFAGKIPLLGVCLGHQAIGEAFGGKIVHAPRLMHGKTSRIKLDTKCAIFKGLPPEIVAMRYHSLIVENGTLPNCFEVTARDEDGEIMGICHREFPVLGIQFHPESFKTERGLDIIRNFCAVSIEKRQIV